VDTSTTDNNATPVENTDVVIVSEDDVMRANFYGLLARVLSGPMDDETLEMMRSLSEHDDDSPLGEAIASFGKLCLRTPKVKAEEEYGLLFHGIGAGGEVTPYSSYYITGLIYDKPLAALREDMARLGIEPAEDNDEPEDHIASLCEMMHGLLMGKLGVGAGSGETKVFFDKHLASWAGKLFADLEGAKSAALYMPVGTIGRLFMDVEREAFSMAA